MPSSSSSAGETKAVILVGGPSRGTRFRPLSLTAPKPLFPIAGEPVIYHHIVALSKVPGLKEILLIGFWEPKIFDEVISRATQQLQVNVKYLREYESLGTGGGLFHFRDQITRNEPEAIFVLHADICCAFPLPQMLAQHRETSASVTLMGTKVPQESSHRYGCLVADPKTHQVLHYAEKPESFISDLISCGVYVLDQNIFKFMETRIKQIQSGELQSDIYGINEQRNKEQLRFEQDVLQPLVGTNKLFVYELAKDSFWRQIKTAAYALLFLDDACAYPTIRSAIPANNLYLEFIGKDEPGRLSRPNTAKGQAELQLEQPVHIHPTAQIDPTAKIGPYVSIGPRVVIGKGCRVKESIILDNSQLQPFSTVLQSVVGWNSRIGMWSRVEGTPPAGWTMARSGGVWPSKTGVKDQSITILGENVSVAPETYVRNCTVLPHKELKSSYSDEILM